MKYKESVVLKDWDERIRIGKLPSSELLPLIMTTKTIWAELWSDDVFEFLDSFHDISKHSRISIENILIEFINVWKKVWILEAINKLKKKYKWDTEKLLSLIF